MVAVEPSPEKGEFIPIPCPPCRGRHRTDFVLKVTKMWKSEGSESDGGLNLKVKLDASLNLHRTRIM